MKIHVPDLVCTRNGSYPVVWQRYARKFPKIRSPCFMLDTTFLEELSQIRNKKIVFCLLKLTYFPSSDHITCRLLSLFLTTWYEFERFLYTKNHKGQKYLHHFCSCLQSAFRTPRWSYATSFLKACICIGLGTPSAAMERGNRLVSQWGLHCGMEERFYCPYTLEVVLCYVVFELIYQL